MHSALFIGTITPARVARSRANDCRPCPSGDHYQNLGPNNYRNLSSYFVARLSAVPRKRARGVIEFSLAARARDGIKHRGTARSVSSPVVRPINKRPLIAASWTAVGVKVTIRSGKTYFIVHREIVTFLDYVF